MSEQFTDAWRRNAAHLTAHGLYDPADEHDPVDAPVLLQHHADGLALRRLHGDAHEVGLDGQLAPAAVGTATENETTMNYPWR